MKSTDDVNGFRVILAWITTIVIIALFDRTRFGHVLLTYMLISIILVLVLKSGQTFTWLLAPLSTQAASVPTYQQTDTQGSPAPTLVG